jgi:F420H(2)-dependent quinone reductase
MDIPRWIEQQAGVRLLRVPDAIYKGTNGRIGHRFMPGIPPNLLLHTTGAKTGQARTTSVAYAHDGDAYLIVASVAIPGPRAGTTT